MTRRLSAPDSFLLSDWSAASNTGLWLVRAVLTHDSLLDPSVSENLCQLKPMEEEKGVGGTNCDGENFHVLNSESL